MLTKEEWIAEQKRHLEEYKKEYTAEEIAEAFRRAKIMKISYIDKSILEVAREELCQQKNLK